MVGQVKVNEDNDFVFSASYLKLIGACTSSGFLSVTVNPELLIIVQLYDRVTPDCFRLLVLS